MRVITLMFILKRNNNKQYYAKKKKTLEKSYVKNSSYNIIHYRHIIFVVLSLIVRIIQIST